MSRRFVEEKQAAASSPIRIPIVVIISIALLAVGFFAVFQAHTAKTLRITHQSTNEEYFSVPVKTSDVLTYGWIHSLEHIPWTEQYIILDNDKLLLKKITMTAFGAGIPHNKGNVTRIENGLIIMDEIDEEFDGINWIHSQTANEYIMLNDEIILIGKDLPHHASLRLNIEKRLKVWQRQE